MMGNTKKAIIIITIIIIIIINLNETKVNNKPSNRYPLKSKKND